MDGNDMVIIERKNTDHVPQFTFGHWLHYYTWGAIPFPLYYHANAVLQVEFVLSYSTESVDWQWSVQCEYETWESNSPKLSVIEPFFLTQTFLLRIFIDPQILSNSAIRNFNFLNGKLKSLTSLLTYTASAVCLKVDCAIAETQGKITAIRPLRCVWMVVFFSFSRCYSLHISVYLKHGCFVAIWLLCP